MNYRSIEKLRADYFQKKANTVIQKDLQYVYSFLCIELYENHGFDTDDLAKLLDDVQQRWVDYAAGTRQVSPLKMCEDITGIKLLS